MDNLWLYSYFVQYLEGAVLKEGKMAAPSAKEPSEKGCHNNHANKKNGRRVHQPHAKKAHNPVQAKRPHPLTAEFIPQNEVYAD